jgi:hypothetical protein
MIGKWKIEIAFPNGDNRVLRFDAQEAGKGSLLLVDPRADHWESAKPAEARWTQDAGNSITFSGAVEFPLGNVGRDPGTLVFKGKCETESLIVGEVDFSPLIGDRPSKSGTFKATRVEGKQ